MTTILLLMLALFSLGEATNPTTQTGLDPTADTNIIQQGTGTGN
jgi:hypothetical protein